MLSRRSRLLLAGLVALQIIVPVIGLMDPPSRFGFQMYSGRGLTSIRIDDAAGRRMDVDLRPLLAANLRMEIDWTVHLPPYLCERVEGAGLVRVEREGTVVERTC